MKKSITFIFMILSLAAMAQGTAAKSIINFQTVLIAIIIVLCIVMFMVVFTLQHVVQLLKEESRDKKAADTSTSSVITEKLSFWERMLALKPLSAEKDVELDHDFDGIKELNNPIPAWFNVLFYGSVVFAFCYLMVYHVFDLAPLQAQEYANQISEAKIAKEAYIKKAGNLVDENSVVQLRDQKTLHEGVETFKTKCMVCHGEKAEGKVGPNLTDKYWLHGGDIKDLFKTIKYGVPAKGMVAWENSLNGTQIQEVASYILSLQGTNPPGAKAPQGDLKGDSIIKSSTAIQLTDTTAIVKN